MPKLSQKAFTDTMLRKIRPAPVRKDHYDAALRGLGIRIAPSGTKTWFVMRRDPDGKMRRRTIGRYPEISLAEARKRAAQISEEIVDGKSPTKKASPTLTSVVDEWFARDQRENRSVAEYRRALAVDLLPSYGDKPIDSITKSDIRRIIDQVADRGAPIQANRLLAYMHRLFSWAVERDIIATSPATGIRPIANEVSRDRTLSQSELAAVWKAAGDMGYPFGPFFQMLILTGQRRGEVAGMRWSEVDLENGEWIIPAERSKNGKAHLVHLPPLAMGKLNQIHGRHGCDLIFTTNGQTPVSGFSKAKATLDWISGTTGWTIHDLRRSFATIATGELGVEPVVVDKILNHSSGAVTGIAAVYQRHAYLDQRKDTMNRWSAYLTRFAGDDSSGTDTGS